MSSNSVSVSRLLSRDAVTQGGFWALAICAAIASCVAFVPSGRKLPHDVAVIACVFFWALPVIFLLVRCVIAANRLARYIPVGGKRLSTGPARGGYAMQYAYEWQGHVHHGGVLTTQRFSEEHPTVTVLVDPAHPDRSTLKELYCEP